MDAYEVASRIAKEFKGLEIHRSSIQKIMREAIMEGIKPYEARIAELERQAERIAELEALLRQEAAIQETEKDKRYAYLESMVAHYRSIEPHVKSRIAEMEADNNAKDARIKDLLDHLMRSRKSNLEMHELCIKLRKDLERAEDAVESLRPLPPVEHVEEFVL